jgi:hypothetical protein
MPLTPDQLRQAANFLFKGIAEDSLRETGRLLWALSPDEIKQLIQKLRYDSAQNVAHLDILGELGNNFRVQKYAIDKMSRQMSSDPQNAHYYNSFFRALRDNTDLLLKIDKQRDKEGRNLHKPPEKADADFIKRQEFAHISQQDMERARQLGYFLHPKFGVAVPDGDLSPDMIVCRDLVRMRMMPRSTYEDYIIMEELGLLKEEEKVENAEWLNDIKIPNRLEEFEVEDLMPVATNYKEYNMLAKKIFLGRLQTYNDTWIKAEEYVEGLMKKFNIKLGQAHTFRGLPRQVRQAAAGDPEAIKELKEIVASPEPIVGTPDDPREGEKLVLPPNVRKTDSKALKAMSDHIRDEVETHQAFAPPKLDPKKPNFGLPIQKMAAFLIGFTLLWNCLCLIVSPEKMLAWIERCNDMPMSQQEPVGWAEREASRNLTGSYRSEAHHRHAGSRCVSLNPCTIPVTEPDPLDSTLLNSSPAYATPVVPASINSTTVTEYRNSGAPVFNSSPGSAWGCTALQAPPAVRHNDTPMSLHYPAGRACPPPRPQAEPGHEWHPPVFQAHSSTPIPTG